MRLNEAWIEIELTAETQVTRVGFWTRTMGSSAQIRSFQIITAIGEIIGPFNLDNAAQTFFFETSGGNTGASDNL